MGTYFRKPITIDAFIYCSIYRKSPPHPLKPTYINTFLDVPSNGSVQQNRH